MIYHRNCVIRQGGDFGESTEEHALYTIADGLIEDQIDDAGEASNGIKLKRQTTLLIHPPEQA